MDSTLSLCSLSVMVVSVALIVYSFYLVFLQKSGGENDLNVIQRQLRGFALLIVANLVMVLGMILCAGSLAPYFIRRLQ